MGSLKLLDTNDLIYQADGKLGQSLGKGTFAISIITEIEVLGFGGLTKSSDAKLRELISELAVIGIDP
ncbi:MAG: hypothetical protein WCG75_07720 [Armatimonadota bacterium]